VAQQVLGALDPAGDQVVVRGRPEGAGEPAAEVCRRRVGGAGGRGYVERLIEAGVEQIARAKQMARRRDHGVIVASHP
jgi:hypothetical protein